MSSSLKSHRKVIVVGLLVTSLASAALEVSMTTASAAGKQATRASITKLPLNDAGKPGFVTTVNGDAVLVIGKKNSDGAPVSLQAGDKIHRLVSIPRGNSKSWKEVVKSTSGTKLASRNITWRNYIAPMPSCNLTEPRLVVTAKRSYGGFIKASNGKKTIYRTLILANNEVTNEWLYGGVTLPQGYEMTGMAGQATGFMSTICQ